MIRVVSGSSQIIHGERIFLGEEQDEPRAGVPFEHLDHGFVALVSNLVKTIADHHHSTVCGHAGCLHLGDQNLRLSNVRVPDKKHVRRKPPSLLLHDSRVDGSVFEVSAHVLKSVAVALKPLPRGFPSADGVFHKDLKFKAGVGSKLIQGIVGLLEGSGVRILRRTHIGAPFHPNGLTPV
jgi:hypothetical protein